jgi:maltooligosyltrehalose synthase
MIIDTILGLVGLGGTIYAITDNRRQRTQREQAVIAARSVIERAVDTSVHSAINDGLAAINQEREMLKSL